MAFDINNWKGYLLRSVDKDAILPAHLIEEGGWDSTPNSREEIKAYRDENTRDLTRITAEGKKTAWKFTTRELHLADKILLQQFFRDGEVMDGGSVDERKIQLEYWDDEENEYKTAYFYRPDIKYTIKTYSDDDIIYKAITVEGVEY